MALFGSNDLGDLYGIARTLLGLKDDGVTQPGPWYQRYRRAEYAGRPFYQWWYFVIKDLAEDRYFAFHLNPVDTIRDHTRQGVYLMFSMIERSAGTRFHKYERFPLASLELGAEPLDVGLDAGTSSFHLRSEGSGDLISVTGELATPAALWFEDGTLDGAPLPAELSVKLDLKLKRLYGWYGQPDLEAQMRHDGLTMWNTYAHTAEVTGTFEVGSKTYTITQEPRFRAYADMNWGSQFLHGEPPEAFPWGWYYASQPAADGGPELAIIAGTGRSADTLLGRSLPGLLGVELAFEGKFADVELGRGRRVGVREVEFFRRIAESDDGGYLARDGLKTVRRASDGGLRRFEVQRSDWVPYVDRFGQARIPRSQLVKLQTTTLELWLHFTCEVEDCFRLLFPQEDHIFSDFEALGAVCHVLILSRDEPRRTRRRSKPQLHVIADFRTNDAGLEFGYLAPGSIG